MFLAFPLIFLQLMPVRAMSTSELTLLKVVVERQEILGPQEEMMELHIEPLSPSNVADGRIPKMWCQ
jgi:hypothetical protein